MQIVIITGMSGAGKSSALNIFEDLGYYSIDNIPPPLISNFVELTEQSRRSFDKLAVGADIRGGIFFDELEEAVNQLRKDGTDVFILFLDASDEVLVRRFKELRRPHPMGEEADLLTGIRKERERVQGIKEQANLIIDTSGRTLGALKETIDAHFLPEGGDIPFIISIITFGFKHGMLLDGDLIFDVRFLPNPYYTEALREKSGLDPEVKEFVFNFNETDVVLDKLTDLCEYLIPLYKREGKRGLTIGVGCTGGKHRSVAIGEALGERLTRLGERTVLYHRDRKHWNE
ncbi:MAG: RNase adapter RapZ [Tissierellia bacterium]|jgi:UPF0042 nucleotide-binding protein|nr:RNase adapter RapZ [Bacillota bacterium]NLK59095.1 RNase adapter RapZ [Tissierellia bacterium]